MDRSVIEASIWGRSTHFENLDQYKHENDFKRCLSGITVEGVKNAVKRADIITEDNSKNGNKLIKYKR